MPAAPRCLPALSPLDWPPLPGRDVSQERTTGSDQTGFPAKRATASGKLTSRREKYEAAVWYETPASRAMPARLRSRSGISSGASSPRGAWQRASHCGRGTSKTRWARRPTTTSLSPAATRAHHASSSRPRLGRREQGVRRPPRQRNIGSPGSRRGPRAQRSPLPHSAISLARPGHIRGAHGATGREPPPCPSAWEGVPDEVAQGA